MFGQQTPEQRRLSAAKGQVTRKARKLQEEAARLEAIAYANGLQEKVTALELKLTSLERIETINVVSIALTNKALLHSDEIVKAAIPWKKFSGVYFLVDNNEVVYVGQARNVQERLSQQHKEKKFTHYAFVPCPIEVMDKLESLYIHCLRPKLNGNRRDGIKNAPLALDELIGIVKKLERTKHLKRKSNETHEASKGNSEEDEQNLLRHE